MPSLKGCWTTFSNNENTWEKAVMNIWTKKEKKKVLNKISILLNMQ